MRRLVYCLLLLLLTCATGCSFYDMLFGAFGSYYSGESGAGSRAEREPDYQRQVDDFNAETDRN